MINIAPYINKLEILKEYMALKISGNGKVLGFYIDCLPPYNPKEIRDIYLQTGVLLSSNEESLYIPKEISFEEFYEERINNFLS